MYNVNFNKTTHANGLPSATVHRVRSTNSNCNPQVKRPEQGHWETWNDLPSEGTYEKREEVTYVVKYCKRIGCIQNQQ